MCIIINYSVDGDHDTADFNSPQLFPSAWTLNLYTTCRSMECKLCIVQYCSVYCKVSACACMREVYINTYEKCVCVAVELKANRP